MWLTALSVLGGSTSVLGYFYFWMCISFGYLFPFWAICHVSSGCSRNERLVLLRERGHRCWKFPACSIFSHRLVSNFWYVLLYSAAFRTFSIYLACVFF